MKLCALGATVRIQIAMTATLALCASGTAGANIVVDGHFDEPEWSSEHSYDAFKITEPFRLSPPDAGTATQAKLVSTPNGIAVAFTLEQLPSIPRIKPRLERDQEDAADSVNFMIDFDGDGRTAYSFSVGLSGSIQDGVVNNEDELNLDWDTAWTSAVSETANGWQVEILIPWSIAPMRGTDTPQRTVAVYFSRTLGGNGERQAYPAVTRGRGQFVSDFERIDIPQYRTALFHYSPYLTASHDLIDGETQFKTGIDIFWKPSPNFQLSATVNPDFGQVEFDDLVINFDAVETFFTDKRPFFTENQSIFDLGTPDSGRLVHTRRIGDEADDGSGASDINAAIKLNGSLGAMSYGVLAASEDGDAGRDFYAVRLQYPLSPDLNVGWLGTDTERSFLDRSAQVHAVDMSWKPSDDLIIRSQTLGTFIDEAGTSTNDTGAWVSVDWAPSDVWNYELEATHFGDQLDFNDLGFQRRASLNEVELTSVYIRRAQDEMSKLASTRLSTELQARSNDHGDNLPTYLILGSVFNFRSGNALYVFGSGITSGWDDRISRGNGLWKKSGRYDFAAQYVTARYGDWTFGSELSLQPQGLSAEAARGLTLNANWYPSDAFNAAIELGPEWTNDWLIWEGGTDFGRYARRVDFGSLKLSWFPGLKHEFRLKSEWLAIRARDGLRYQLQPSGHMLPAGAERPDFDINNFGMQIRYRYLLGPQSDIVLAYSRGGFLRQDREDADTSSLFQEALELRDADQFLAKIRYQF